ncbi:MAG TPA: sporulation peptidase YabG [Ruminiclostridium sp.]
MKQIEIGCLVCRKSYERDIIFRVSDIICDQKKKTIMLKGVDVRLEADSEEEDLDIIEKDEEMISGNIS